MIVNIPSAALLRVCAKAMALLTCGVLDIALSNSVDALTVLLTLSC